MLRYLEFIKENLLLESQVVFSNKLRAVLGKVDHPLANTLLDIENKDLPVQSNYLDIASDKNDTISFIPDRRAQEILGDAKEVVRFTGGDGGWLRHSDANNDLFSKLGYTPEGEPYRPQGDEIGNVIARVTSATSGRVYVYVQFENGKGVYNQERLADASDKMQKIWTRGRQEIKIGRIARALLQASKSDIVDKDIESFVNSFKATIDKFNDKFQLFEEIKGEQIGYWYNSRNYKERRGTLGNSCMSGVPQTFFDIYISNPDVCSLIILKDQDNEQKIVARALLWTLSDGKKFVDRIYTINDSDVQLFKDYAKENDWYVKFRNASIASSEAIDPNSGEKVNLPTMNINIKKGYYDKYPYLDTFKHWSPSSGILSISGGSYTLEYTDGGYEDSGCESCDGSGRVTCYECDGEGSYTCPRCDGDGYIEKKDDEGNVIKETCPRCDGDESVSCRECYGEGYRDCPECS